MLTYYRFKARKTEKVLFGIFLFVLLLLARDTMISQALVGVTLSQFLNLGLMALLGVAFLAANHKQLKEFVLDKRMIAIAVSTLVILLPMVVKQDWQMMYFSILLCIYFAVFLTYFISYREVAKFYVVIMAFLGVYSLIATYGLKYLVEAGNLQVPIFHNAVGGHEFYNFGLAFVIKLPYEYYRNSGIFREPGVYQFFSLLALYLNNYAVVWKKTWKVWTVNFILAAIMLSTISTVGVIVLGLFAIVLFFDKGFFRNKRIRYAVIVLLIAGVSIFLIYLPHNAMLEYEVTNMIKKLWTITPSSNARFGSIFTDLSIFLRHPLFGGDFSTVLHAVFDNTSSTMILYAALGVLGGTLNVAAWIALVWEKERKVWVNLALLMILFMSINTQNLTWDVFFWLFPMMALVERGLPLLKVERLFKKA